MKFTADDLVLYAVTDRTWLEDKTLSEVVEAALQGGVTLIQLREKELDYEGYLAEALEIKKVCDRYGVPMIINDNVEIALASGADGVHLGQKDGDVAKVRERLGKSKIIGVSARTLEQALEAQANGADYLGVGAAFGSKTKLDAQALSHKVIQTITETVDIPVVAIGGINRQNAMELRGTKVQGIAVISDLFAQGDVKKAAQTLKYIAEQVAGKK
ncbi:MAG: thiamine phosphate synthase [Clostridium sp.]|nr:thiamine phosphate synthase [Clostridium sp.]